MLVWTWVQGYDPGYNLVSVPDPNQLQCGSLSEAIYTLDERSGYEDITLGTRVGASVRGYGLGYEGYDPAYEGTALV